MFFFFVLSFIFMMVFVFMYVYNIKSYILYAIYVIKIVKNTVQSTRDAPEYGLM